MDGLFYSDKTIVRLLSSRYAKVNKRDSFSQQRDLHGISLDIDSILWFIRVRKLLTSSETERYERFINAALLRAKDIAEQAMKDVDELGRASRYGHMARFMGSQADHWGVELLIHKAQYLVRRIGGLCMDLERVTGAKQAKGICKDIQRHLIAFPLMDIDPRGFVPRWFGKLLRNGPTQKTDLEKLGSALLYKYSIVWAVSTFISWLSLRCLLGF